MSLDINGRYDAINLLVPQDVTGAVNGNGVDVSAYEGKLKVTLSVGAFSGTNVDVKIQDSADDSTYADVTDGAFTSVTGANAFESIAIDTRAVQKYIRVDISGTVTSAITSVTAVGSAKYK